MAESTIKTDKTKLLTAQQVIRVVVMLAFFCALMFGSAGTFNWWQGWAFLVVGVFGWMILGRIHLATVYPDLIQERASFDEKSDVKAWDRWLMPVVALVGPLAMLVVAGLDKRFGWSGGIPLWAQITALAGFTLFTLFGHWAAMSNRYFSAVVRIQTDRGHRVADSGPYRIMRHPAYAASVLSYGVLPVFFSSLWAFIPAGIIVAGYILRTALEDRALIAELPGYSEFAQRTRYRLFPGIW